MQFDFDLQQVVESVITEIINRYHYKEYLYIGCIHSPKINLMKMFIEISHIFFTKVVKF